MKYLLPLAFLGLFGAGCLSAVPTTPYAVEPQPITQQPNDEQPIVTSSTDAVVVPIATTTSATQPQIVVTEVVQNDGKARVAVETKPVTAPPTVVPVKEAPVEIKPVPPAPAPKPVESVRVIVQMSETGFKPASLSVAKGATVVFQNVGNDNMWPASNPHPVHTDYSDFDALRSIAPGETYSFIFKDSGTFRYHDHVHAGRMGSVIVE